MKGGWFEILGIIVTYMYLSGTKTRAHLISSNRGINS